MVHLFRRAQLMMMVWMSLSSALRASISFLLLRSARCFGLSVDGGFKKFYEFKPSWRSSWSMRTKARLSWVLLQCEPRLTVCISEAVALLGHQGCDHAVNVDPLLPLTL